jgi:bla regulator protein blaR1
MRSKENCTRLLLVAATCFALDIASSAQIIHASDPLPSFEVATIKPASPQPRPSSTSPAEVRISNVTARNLIEQAYGIPWTSAENERVLGGPAWLDTNRYDIVARIPADLAEAQQKLSRDQQKQQISLMLQSLLAERFHLKLHFETRVLTVYALVVAKPHPYLVESAIQPQSAQPQPTGPESPAPISLPSKPEGLRHGILVLYNGQSAKMTARQASLDDLVHWFAGYSEVGGRPVVNQTGRTGLYDFTLRWTRQSLAATPQPASSDAADTDAPPLFTALPDQLGLRFNTTKAPVEVILIDHTDPPTDN